MAEQLPALKARWPPASRSCSSSQVMVTELRAPCNGCWSAANGEHVHAPHSEAAHPTTVTLLPFCVTAPACLPLAPRLFVHSRRWICGKGTASARVTMQVRARQGGPRDQRARSTSRTSVSSQPSPSHSCTRTDRGRNARKHRPSAARRGGMPAGMWSRAPVGLSARSRPTGTGHQRRSWTAAPTPMPLAPRLRRPRRTPAPRARRSEHK